MPGTFSRITSTGPALMLLGLLVPGVSAAANIAVSELDSVRIEALAAGLPIDKKARYRVTDITMGSLSVLHLFEEIQHQTPTGWRYFSGTKDSVVLKLQSESALAELRETALMRDKATLDIILQDATDTFMRHLEPLAQFSRVVRIPIVLEGSLSPCEEISRITYRRIDEKLEDMRKAGLTDEPIDLDQLFSMLLTEEIGSYIDKLDPPDRESSCFRDFHLLEWTKNETVDKFGFKSYALHPGLQSLLRGVVYSLSKSAWEKTRFSIDLIGYTDQIPFEANKSLPVELAGTGLQEGDEPALSIYYAGCEDDRLTGSAVPLVFGEESGLPVGAQIENNCELGAARAYVAAIFLRNLLSRWQADISYGTGGIFDAQEAQGGAKPQGDPYRRRVQVRIKIRTAEERPSILRDGDQDN